MQAEGRQGQRQDRVTGLSKEAVPGVDSQTAAWSCRVSGRPQRHRAGGFLQHSDLGAPEDQNIACVKMLSAV